MNSQPKPVFFLIVILFTSGLGTSCDHRPRASTGHDVPRAIHAADDSRTVDRMSRGPSIVRESIDARCFGPAQENNTEVIACPRQIQLAVAAE